jgi:hypothetical protein
MRSHGGSGSRTNSSLPQGQAWPQYRYGLRLAEPPSWIGRAQLTFAPSFEPPETSSLNVHFGKTFDLERQAISSTHPRFTHFA